MITGKDRLGREVFWELNDDFKTRQYTIYLFEDNECSVIYFPRYEEIIFGDENGEVCSEEVFFRLVNKI